MSIISVNPIYPDLENQFPAEIDVIKRFIDPALEDLQTINRYYSYIDNGNLVAANALLETNPRLKQMCLNAGSLNPLVDAVISMQRYYINDIQRYLVNIVKAKGNWSASARYTKYDVVQHVNASAIESYMGLVDVIPIGALPTNLDYFTPLTLRGEQGASGTGLSPRGAWDSIIQYYQDDCVSHNNVLWAAKTDNVNSIPQDISNAWEPVLKVPKQIIFSASEPTGQTVNEIWFKELGANTCEVYQKQSNGTYKLILVNANNALTANRALNADNATRATTADNATKAYGKAENMLSVSYASSAGSATSANRAASADAVAWVNVSGKPTDWAPSAHNHDNLYLSKNGGVINGNLAVTGSLSGMTYSNDYAEYRQSQKYVRGGQIVIEDLANDDYVCESNARLDPTAMIVSDTYGMVIGIVDNDCAFPLPIAVSGRALVYPCEDRSSFKIGDCVCSGEHGTVSRMSEAEIKQYPHCIVGVVSSIPMYHLWGGNSVDVDGRIWVRIR